MLQKHSVQSLSHVRLFVTPWTAACQASLYITTSRSLLKLLSIESVMPYNHLILCHPRLLLPSILPNIRVFSNVLALHIRWPQHWSFSLSISPSNEWASLLAHMVKNPPAMWETLGLIPELGRSPGEWNGYPLQYSCLENSKDRRAWWATTVHGVAKSRTRLSD